MYNYFIYYTFRSKDGHIGDGNVIRNMGYKISKGRDVLDISNDILKISPELLNVTISNIILL